MELIGGTSKNDPIEVLINGAPAWRRAIENGVRFWTGFPNGEKIVMVREDIWMFSVDKYIYMNIIFLLRTTPFLAHFICYF